VTYSVGIERFIAIDPCTHLLTLAERMVSMDKTPLKSRLDLSTSNISSNAGLECSFVLPFLCQERYGKKIGDTAYSILTLLPKACPIAKRYPKTAEGMQMRMGGLFRGPAKQMVNCQPLPPPLQVPEASTRQIFSARKRSQAVNVRDPFPGPREARITHLQACRPLESCFMHAM
jgi:hypothetical protein